MAKKKKTVKDLLLDGFSGFSMHSFGKTLSEEERVSWCAAITMLQNPSSGFSSSEFIETARRIKEEL